MENTIRKYHRILFIALIVLALGLVALDYFSGALVCKSRDVDTLDCVTIWNSGWLSMYTNPGTTLNFQVNGDTGNIYARGIVTATKFMVAGTPIVHPTAIATATPLSVGGVITATAVRAGEFSIAGTPVFWATPIPTATALPFIIRGETQANYTQGDSITHGFSITATWCIISPMQNITATYTITETGFSSDMQTTTNPIMWQCGKTP